jgi:predicted methyltransferase
MSRERDDFGEAWMKSLLTLALAATGLLAVGLAEAATLPAYVTAAVADAGRPDADKQRDTNRKPGELLVFAGVKPGTKIVDMIPGGGYFTRIFAKAVGDKGYVYAYVPSELDELIKKRYGSTDVSKLFAAYPNVSVIHAPIAKLVTPESVDIVWTDDNYHDLHDSFFGPADLSVVNKAVYAALKPGGVYVVVDHAAPNGSGLADTETLHRIDEAVVKKEVEAAGFKLVGESAVLRNPSDDRTAKVFDSAIRGKTDQFVLKFRKPAH